MHFEYLCVYFLYDTDKDKCFNKINYYLFQVLNYAKLVSYNFAHE